MKSATPHRQLILRCAAACAGRYAIVFVVSCFAQPLWAATFTTSLAAVEWQVSSSRFECKLSHAISGYGSAVFSRGAGESEVFYLRQKHLILPAGEATINAAHASWQAENAVQTIGRATVVGEQIPLRAEATLAKKLQAQLLEGMRIIVTRAIEGEFNPVRVVLEPLKFRNAHQQYIDCFTRLLPVSFAQVSRTTLYFNDAADDLLANELQKLNWLVSYAKTDKRVGQIIIDGHADSQGPRPDNMQISQRRAERVAAYLIKAGVSDNRITVRWHGERYPVASNNDAQGRLQNRRVTLRIESGS